MAATADKFSRLAALKPARAMPARPSSLRAPDEEDALGRLLGAGVSKNRFGEHLTVRNWFSTPEFSEPSPVALELLSRTRDEALSRKTRAALSDPARWLFLDTETTGLAGGTGTYAFLIGLAWWDAGGLQVEQFFMRDFAEEHSLLQEFSQRVAERPVLVTFNGKSFDWPLLENRFTMTRSIAVPKLAAHLDLLHPARALWKLRLGSVPLAGVVHHNQMDLRGLAALFGKINSLLADDNCNSENVESLDLFGLSRFLQRRGEADRAQSACSQALAIGLPVEFRPKARRELALMAKRRGEHARAAEIWLEIAADPRDGVHACEQLAIYYEHHAKDLSRAAEFAQLALAKLRPQRCASHDPDLAGRSARLEQKFLHRLARLQHRIKISRGLARPLALSCSSGESQA